MATTTGKELPFPKTQEEMTKYRSDYTFTEGKWYDQTQPTLGAIQTGVSAVAEKASALQTAISAGDLTEGAGAVQPITPDSTAGDAGAAIINASGVGTMMQSMLDQMTSAQERSDKLAEQQQTWFQKLTSKTTKSQTELLAEHQEKWGMPETFQQMKDITALTLPLQQQIADLTNREQREIDINEASAKPQPLIDREANAITNKYNKLKAPIATQLNAYAAQTQALQGNLSIANQFATQAVNAATYDQEFEYNQIKDFMSINQGFLDTLKADERFYFTNALALSKETLDIARSDANYIEQLSLQFPQAGISLASDTRASATSKASAWSGQQPSEFALWKQKQDYAAGLAETTGDGLAVFGDDEGNQYDLGTISGLNQFKVDNPDYTYADMNAFLDQNVKGMDASTRKQLLEGSDFKQDTKMDKQGVIDWAREQFESDYSKDEIKTALLETYPKDWVNEAIDSLEYTWLEKGINWLTGGRFQKQ